MSAAQPDDGPARRASVVISARNRVEMLKDCLRGLARQTIGTDAFEVVLVDNCSTDDYAPVHEYARSLGLAIRGVRTLRDGGPAPARNLGVQTAIGPVIAFTDSDCRPTPTWLACILAAMDDPAIAMASGPVLPKPEQPIKARSRETFITPTEHPSFPTANLALRRDVFLALGGFDTTLSFTDPFGRAIEAADTDLAWRIIKSGHGRAFLPEAVVEHEVEQLSLWLWIIEPSRLFIVPALVRRHPELRDALLTWRVLFYAPSVVLYLGAPLALAAAWLAPAWLAAALFAVLAAALVVRSAVRRRSLNPVVVGRQCLRVLANLPRLAIMSTALIYGSIRYRCLVL
jgi:glycosyltransferase involved in cell wall biosynthesis